MSNAAQHKHFDMPVVQCIPFSMGETVASNCCYSRTYAPNGMAQSARSLNGGIVGTSSMYAVYPSVVNSFGGVQNIPKYHYTYFYPNNYDLCYYDETALRHGNWGYWAKEVVAANPVGASQPYQLWVVDSGDVYEAQVLPGSYVQLTVPYCDHVSQKCPFNQMVGGGLQHIGATTPHAFAGFQWWCNHTAVQFNS